MRFVAPAGCLRLLALLAAAGGPAGCSDEWVAARLIAVPNADRFVGRHDDASRAELARLGVDRQLRFEVGQPAASLCTWVLEPGPGHCRGTILVLHDYRRSSVRMLPAARAVAESGYRAVLVDLRGHGRSGGRFGTYGLLEGRDLVGVLDLLRDAGLAEPPIGVYGASWGAAAGLHLAAHDPRVEAVVAVSAFTSMRDAAPLYVRSFVPMGGLVAGGDRLDRAVNDAGLLGGFDPDEASTLRAVAETSAAVLLVHGREDGLIPSAHSRRLHEAAGIDAELLIVPNADHETIWLGRGLRRVNDAALSWFEQRLRPASSVPGERAEQQSAGEAQQRPREHERQAEDEP